MREETIASIHNLAKKNDQVVFIGSDLGHHTLSEMKKEYPERFFMEGISEQHIIGMAAGLAMEGFIPYVVTISTFLVRRCLEQIYVDACLHSLPLRLIGFGGGIVYAPLGPTHWATDDFALLRPLPTMSILAPADAYESVELLDHTLNWPGPVFMRLGRGDEELLPGGEKDVKINQARVLYPAGEIAILSTGILTHEGLKACELLAKKGLSAGLLHLSTVKPLDKPAILKFIQNSSAVVTLEEHTLIGGLGSAIAELILETVSMPPKFFRLALPDELLTGYGTRETQIERYGLSAEQIANKILEQMNHAILS